MEHIIELFHKQAFISCFCEERFSKFKPCREDDNEFWWCEVHQFQGVVLCEG